MAELSLEDAKTMTLGDLRVMTCPTCGAKAPRFQTVRIVVDDVMQYRCAACTLALPAMEDHD